MESAVPPPWTGIVLAGGRSSRMGVDKAMLTWRGRTLLDHALQLLRAAGAAQVLICGRSGQGGSAGFADRTPWQGPLAALGQLSDHLRDGACLVIPVDMPLLSPALLQRLASADTQCAHVAGHPLPMWIRLNTTSRAVLAQLQTAAPRDQSLRRLQQLLGSTELDVADWQQQLRGCNTPEEWAALQADERHPQSDASI